ncbi:Cytochrome c oxidase subunit 6A, mitochondrial [Apiotrichum porosum]|uniref:Cytochrome c oxidase subunit 6A, mitochondrial n=1 Tax=Apiotrichum porosum TaxID=105984 RepID=A0A427Y4F2_9TREE|nr:Cytochrome c oxidase subunit 6A, mitochondrial [Apiotrichum porosum]RSH85964.1 Cytochrome c oxidase subunit 6A, mitochondrial [Apiotrichum porosum]
MLRAARPAAQVARAVRTRGFTSTSGAPNEFLAERAAAEAHAKETTNLWKNISFYVCIPAIIGGAAWTYKLEAAHHEHLEHIKHDNGGEMPAIPDYEYLNIRKAMDTGRRRVWTLDWTGEVGQRLSSGG